MSLFFKDSRLLPSLSFVHWHNEPFSQRSHKSRGFRTFTPAWPALMVLAAVLLGAGCVSDRKAQMEARQAYLAGQQQAVQGRENTFNVTVQGQVRNHVIPWTIDLTLARAIVQANYNGIFNPKIIRVFRNGQTIEVDPNDLLKGADMPLQAGDTVQIVN
jgi:hypothetical protein